MEVSLAPRPSGCGAGTQEGEKYGQVLRDAIADNPDVAVLHLRLDTLIRATRVEFRKDGSA